MELLQLFGLSLLGSIAGLIGGVIFLVRKDLCKPLSKIAIPLAAGVLLALSLLDLFPEAVEQVGDTAFTVVLSVFVLSFLTEKFLFSLHHHEDHDHAHEHKDAVSLVIFGDTIHNFLDGVAIGASFLIDPSLGLFVSLATFLHETPHEIADFGILVSNGWSRKRAFMANFFSAIFTIPGAFLTYFFAAKIESGTGILLSVAAGLFLYVASTDFLPELSHDHGKSNVKQAFFLILGIILIALLKVFVPEMH